MQDKNLLTGPVGQAVAEAALVPLDHITGLIVLAEYNNGIVVLHTLCCEQHLVEALTEVANRAPNLVIPYGEQQEN